jgi:hypothetical protein
MLHGTGRYRLSSAHAKNNVKVIRYLLIGQQAEAK